MWEHGYASYSPYCITYSQRLRFLVNSGEVETWLLSSVDSITYYPRISAVTDLASSSQSVFDFVRNKIRLNLEFVMPTPYSSIGSCHWGKGWRENSIMSIRCSALSWGRVVVSHSLLRPSPCTNLSIAISDICFNQILKALEIKVLNVWQLCAFCLHVTISSEDAISKSPPSTHIDT